MEKITLKLYELYSLEAELGGVFDRETGKELSKGLLSQNIKFSIKYWLTKLFNTITEEKKVVEKLREDLVKKYGTEAEDGNVSIKQFVTDEEGRLKQPLELTKEYQEFDKDLLDVLNQEKELEHFSFKLSHFSTLTTDVNYPTFFKLVKDDSEEV